MSQTTPGKKVIRRKPGKNLPELVSKLTSDDVYAAIIELIANSYDADATKVSVIYYPDDRKLTITDNGSGMGPEELEKHFYSMGDSPKLEEMVSPNGRRMFGDRGVATLVLKYLGGEYTLVTKKEGVESTVEEVFEEDVLTTEKKLTVKKTPCDESNHGTTIALSHLNFGEKTDFSLEELKKRIQWELPCGLPDFNIWVGGDEIQDKSIEKSTEFVFDEEGKEMGRVHGSIYYANQPTKKKGIHMYVNKRRVGDPLSFFADFPKAGMYYRVIAILHADDLEDAISFDRGRFRADHPGFLEFKEHLKNALREIRRYSKDRAGVQLYERIIKERPILLEKIASKVKSAGIEEIDRMTEFVFDESLPDRNVGIYNADENILLLNPNHPSLLATSQANSQQYEMLLLHAVVGTLARYRTKKQRRTGLNALEDSVTEIWKDLAVKESDIPSKISIYPRAVYSVAELTQHSGLSLTSIRYMIRTGFLPQHKDGEVVGKEYQKVEESTEGMIPLPEVLKKKVKITTGAFKQKMERIEKILEVVGSSYEPFIRNHNPDGEPCYFIEGTCAGEVMDFLLSEELRNKRVGKGFKLFFETFGDRYFSIPILSKRLKLKLTDVSSVFDYAKSEGLNITSNTAKKSVSHNYADFINAMQHMRGNLSG